MSLKTDLSEKLKMIADNPENEFDRELSLSKAFLSDMSEAQLSDIYTLRRKAANLCRMMPYPRKDIELLVSSGAVKAVSKAAELTDCFTTLDFIISKAKGEKF